MDKRERRVTLPRSDCEEEEDTPKLWTIARPQSQKLEDPATPQWLTRKSYGSYVQIKRKNKL